MIKHVPNILTISNLAFGCLSIISVLQGNAQLAAYFVLAGAIFDFFDGFLARLLNAYSAMGKQLDSLADLVTFGVAPGVIIYHLLSDSEIAEQYSFIPYIALILPLAAAWRLAKFNLDDSQSKTFRGLPSPAAGICAASFALPHPEVWFQDIFNPTILIAGVIILSLLMLSPFQIFSLKFQNTSWSDNKIRYVFLILCLMMIQPIGLNFTLISLIILLYIILAVGNSLLIAVKK